MKIKHITRMNYGRTIGWWVRISKFKRHKQKFFPDLRHGSKDWALIQAMIWLDQAVDNLNNTKIPLKVLLKRPTGMQHKAIGRIRRYKNPMGVTMWIVTMGKGRFKSFSTATWGEYGAQKKAQAWANVYNRKLGYKTIVK